MKAPLSTTQGQVCCLRFQASTAQEAGTRLPPSQTNRRLARSWCWRWLTTVGASAQTDVAKYIPAVRTRPTTAEMTMRSTPAMRNPTLPLWLWGMASCTGRMEAAPDAGERCESTRDPLVIGHDQHPV